MSTSVVIEPPPPTPPPATAPSPAVADVHHSPVQQLNGASSPAPVASVEAAASTAEASERISTPTEPTPVDGDVEMTTQPATEPSQPVSKELHLKQEAIVADELTLETGATPMEVDPEAEPTNAIAPEPVVIEYKTREKEDDARAIAMAKRRLEIQLTFLENARRKILDETHPDFQQRMVAVDAEREHLLNKAKEKESYWEHCTSVIYAYECEEATSEFMLNCDRLRQEMLEEIHHEIEIINDQRKGSSSSRKTTRKTRSTRTKAGGEEKSFALDTTHKPVKKRVGNVFQQLENKLAQSEVDHDLRELAVSMDAVSKKRRMDATQSPFVAKYHRSNFLYRDAVYQEGDEIFVRNLMNGSDYVAIICSITSTELFVLSEKGKYTRLVFMDLRQGRVVVSPLTSDQTAALNEREERVALRS